MFENKKLLDKKQTSNRAPSRKPLSGQTIQRRSICTYTPYTLRCHVPDEKSSIVETNVGIDSTVLIDGAGVTSGSAPYTERNGIYYYLDDYVKGHIVNQELGGDGIPDNLFPFSHGTNSRHYTKIESPVKKAYKNFLNNHNNGDLFYYHCWLTGDAVTKDVLSFPEEVDKITISYDCHIKLADGQTIPANTGTCSAKDYDPDFDGSSIKNYSMSDTQIQTRGQYEKEYLNTLIGFNPHDSDAYKHITAQFGAKIKSGELLQIAQTLCNICGLKISRIEKRNFTALIKWFDDNWDRIRPIIDYITLSDKPAH